MSKTDYQKDVLKYTNKDVGYSVAKAVIGSIPVIGAGASELLGIIVKSPLEQRRDKWATEIGEQLADLEDKAKLRLEELPNNPLFLDVVLSATQIAIKTSESEKIKALKNAVLNVAIGEWINETESKILLDVLDRITECHLKILYVLEERHNDNEGYPMSFYDVIREGFPDIYKQDRLFNLVWQDLINKELVINEEPATNYHPGALTRNPIKPLGVRLLKFINDNNAN